MYCFEVIFRKIIERDMRNVFFGNFFKNDFRVMYSLVLYYSFNRRKYLLVLFINFYFVIEVDFYK